ncbi:hypothetical protein D3C87_540900 [compost metagenome]
MNTLTRIALLGDVASIRQGHPFRGAIAAVAEGPVQVIQLKNLALDGLQERDHLLRTALRARKPPDWVQDQDVLIAARGNHPLAMLLLALQLLAAHQAGSRNGAPVAPYAVSRVNEIRGDLRAAIEREVMMPTPLTPEQRLLGEAEALRQNKTMDKLYFDKCGAPTEFIPRPRGHS